MAATSPGRLLWLIVMAATAPIALWGCRADTTESPSKSSPPAAETASSSDRAVDQTWDAYFLKGAKIGYGETTVRRKDRAGEPLVETRSASHLKLERFGKPVEQDLDLSTLETPEGRLLEFRTEVAFGPSPMVVVGHVEGDAMIVQTSTQGTRQEARLDWSPEIRGFFGVDQSLATSPLKPGETRQLRTLMPLLNDVASVTLTAAQEESTELLDGQATLLRIETTARMSDGNAMTETLWTNRQGEVLKRRIAGLDQESYRTTREIAEADAAKGAPAIDLGTDTIVRVDPPLPNAHQTRQVRYRVSLPKQDPAQIFSSGPTQSIRATDAHSAELTVRSLRPSDAGQDGPPTENSADDESIDPRYTGPNSVLQTGDSTIQEMAAEARGEKTDPAAVALALERYVHDTLSSHDLTQAFATAAEVAKTRSGDCTEHAVLLAALARACGIPSRVAIGLVYVDRAGGFGYHMWTEVLLDGTWIPLDATLGQGGIGAAHLKLVDSSLDGANAYSAFLPVAQVVGQLKIKVLDAE